MHPRRRILSAALLAVPVGARRQALAQDAPAAPSAGNLFAIEFRVGPKWDTAKKAHEQSFFREHSANLKRLRDHGSLLLGARYGDKGFLVLAAETEAAARSLVDVDPAVQNQVFAYEVHPFLVFYSGCVQPAKRPA